MDVPNLVIEDIVITGSNANYNWTEKSDIDLHLIVDMERFRLECPDLVDDFFKNKKTLWNTQHDIQIYGYTVEVYVQDSTESHISAGQYSLQDDKWISIPKYKPPQIDDNAVVAKAKQYKYEIAELIDINGDIDAVNELKDKVRKLRQTGLENGGEFSTENLVFKELRNSGYLDKLYTYGVEVIDSHYSLDKDLLAKPDID
jgi:hypothetical protein